MARAAHPALLGRVGRGRWLALDRLAAGGYALLVISMLAKYAHDPVGVLALAAVATAFAAPIAVRRRWPLPAVCVVAGVQALTLLVQPTAPIAVRRRWPLPAVCVVAGVQALTLLVQPAAYLAGVVPLAAASYVAATGPGRRAFAALAVALAAAGAAALPGFEHVGATVASGLGYLAVWAVGYAVGLHRRYTAELLRSHGRRAAEELARARGDVLAERLRIARELHDVISHSMSVITVQAALGALVIDTRPAQARSALDAIETTGRQSLTELRALLDVLRGADRDGPGAAHPDRAGAVEPLAPSPSLADLDRLVAQTGRAGVRVHVTESVHPHPLPPGVELAAYRIVQEALTNVVRHADASTARVVIDHRTGELVVEITDTGGAVSEPKPGHGLIGMRERVSAFGGTLVAAPRADGGFGVHARIPLPDPAGRRRSVPAV